MSACHDDELFDTPLTLSEKKMKKESKSEAEERTKPVDPLDGGQGVVDGCWSEGAEWVEGCASVGEEGNSDGGEEEAKKQGRGQAFLAWAWANGQDRGDQ